MFKEKAKGGGGGVGAGVWIQEDLGPHAEKSEQPLCGFIWIWRSAHAETET